MSIDSNDFRQVLGHFSTGVTVVSAVSPTGNPVGLTIGSFVSVSLDPPYVGFFAMVNSDRWRDVEASGSFCVNVLGTAQTSLCWRFAKSSIAEPFEGVEWHPSPISGSPVLEGSIAWIDCAIEKVIEAGDHYFVLGQVLQLEHVDPETEPSPLLFYRGGIGTFAPNA